MIDCYCDYDPPTFFQKRLVQAARSNHKCSECGRTIYGGEPYEYVSGKWDDLFARFYTCSDCVSLRTWGEEAVPCFCWAHGSLRDDLAEMVENYRSEVPGFYFEYGRLIIKARRRRAELDKKAVQAA